MRGAGRERDWEAASRVRWLQHRGRLPYRGTAGIAWRVPKGLTGKAFFLAIGICLMACPLARTAFASEIYLEHEFRAYVFESSPKGDSAAMVVAAAPAGAMAERRDGPLVASPRTEESLFSKDYFKLLWADTKFILASPARWETKEWLAFSAAALGVGAISLLDRTVWDMIKRNQSKTGDDIANIAEKVGGVYSLGVAVTFYVAGDLLDNPKAKSVALDGFAASLLAAGIISPVLKFAVGRSAPRDEEGTGRFRPFSVGYPFSGEGQSFPSGHAAQSFAVASVIAAHYDPLWVKITAYSLATAASLARVYQGAHFISDWTAGVLIGTAVGHAVVHFNERARKAKKESALLPMPFAVPGGFGVMVGVRFDSW